MQVSTFIHEVLHGLAFHPNHFEQFPKNKKGESFLFEDENENFKLRGNNTLDAIKDHFGCDSIDGGIIFLKQNQFQLFIC